MKIFMLLLLLASNVYAADHTVLGDPSGNDNPGYNGKYSLRVNSSGQVTQTLQAGEDQTNGVQKVETQMSPKFCTADCQVSADANSFVESITCGGTDAAAQAGGVIALYDNTAESGSTYWNYSPPAANVQPFTNILKHTMPTGIYLGFPAGATDIWCTVSYR